MSLLGGALALALGVGYAFGFALNDYFDAELDAKDEFKAINNYFVHNSIPKIIVIPVITSIIFSLLLIFLQFGIIGVVILFFLLFIIWGYSAEPLKFKRRAGFDILIHAIFVQTNPYLVTLILFSVSLNQFDYWLLGLLFLSSFRGQLAGQIRDYYLDAITHQTFAIKIGMQNARKTYYFVLALLLFTVILGISFQIIPLFIIPLLFLGIIFTLFRPITNPKPKCSEYLDKVLALIAIIYTAIIIIIALFYSDAIDVVSF